MAYTNTPVKEKTRLGKGTLPWHLAKRAELPQAKLASWAKGFDLEPQEITVGKLKTLVVFNRHALKRLGQRTVGDFLTPAKVAKAIETLAKNETVSKAMLDYELAWDDDLEKVTTSGSDKAIESILVMKKGQGLGYVLRCGIGYIEVVTVYYEDWKSSVKRCTKIIEVV